MEGVTTPAARLPARAAILEYHASRDGTLVFLVAEGASSPSVFEARMDGHPVTSEDLARCARRLIVDFHGLPPGWDLRDDAAAYREALSLPPAVHAAKRSKDVNEINLVKPAFAYRMDYWEALSEALLPTALREQLADVEVLCIVPHGTLHGMPFAALRWSETEYLIDRFGLCSAPSASVLRYCRARDASGRAGSSAGRPNTALVAAVAAADDQDPAVFEADADTLAGLLDPMRSAGRVAWLVGARAGEGRSPASRERVLADVAGRGLVHIACHGIFGVDGLGGDAMSSGLLVSDGDEIPPLAQVAGMDPQDRARFFISARDVLDLDLDATLVVLRACSSGRSAVGSGDELAGLTRAFLFAGAASLVVSLWNVNIRSSRLLLSRFYEAWLAPGAATAKWQALRAAQIAVRATPGYEHPFHWAPFVLAGDWQ